MNWYVVTCRISGDDEDSCYVVRTDTWQHAARRAEQDMREQIGEAMPAEDHDVDSEDPDFSEFYVNYVVNCGDTKPMLECGHGSEMPATTGGGELDDDCEFVKDDADGWHCTTHDCTMIQQAEPVMCIKNPERPDHD